MEIKLYTSAVCPKCNILKKKLAQKNIAYELVEGEEAVKAGVDFVPVLEVNGEKLNFVNANEWINRQEG